MNVSYIASDTVIHVSNYWLQSAVTGFIIGIVFALGFAFLSAIAEGITSLGSSDQSVTYFMLRQGLVIILGCTFGGAVFGAIGVPWWGVVFLFIVGILITLISYWLQSSVKRH